MDIPTIDPERTGANIFKSGADFHFQQKNSGFRLSGRRPPWVSTHSWRLQRSVKP